MNYDDYDLDLDANHCGAEAPGTDLRCNKHAGHSNEHAHRDLERFGVGGGYTWPRDAKPCGALAPGTTNLRCTDTTGHRFDHSTRTGIVGHSIESLHWPRTAEAFTHDPVREAARDALAAEPEHPGPEPVEHPEAASRRSSLWATLFDSLPEQIAGIKFIDVGIAPKIPVDVTPRSFSTQFTEQTARNVRHGATAAPKAGDAVLGYGIEDYACDPKTIITPPAEPYRMPVPTDAEAVGSRLHVEDYLAAMRSGAEQMIVSEVLRETAFGYGIEYGHGTPAVPTIPTRRDRIRARIAEARFRVREAWTIIRHGVDTY